MSVATLVTKACAGSQAAVASGCRQTATVAKANEPDRQLLRIGSPANGFEVYEQLPQCPSGLAQYGGFTAPAAADGTAFVALEKPIGNGAFGVVWRVRDPRDGSRLALKKIAGVLDSAVSARRACRELAFLGSLRHENIVAAVGVLQEANFPADIYLLCNLMETDLHRIIVSPQPLSPDHVKLFMYQLLRGLKYLHSGSILHRDIKPGNLLVNSDCRLRICDFGLARVHGASTDEAASLTLEVVTQYYRAPELLMGAREYTAAIDVWSAGCVLAELLGRRILFQASTPLGQLDLILDLLGTPDPAAAASLSGACAAARRYVRRLPARGPRLAAALWAASPSVTVEALHLLELLLRFNPSHRSTAAAALSHPYLEDARNRYHSCMCTCCCVTDSKGGKVWQPRFQKPGNGPEPIFEFSASSEQPKPLVVKPDRQPPKDSAARPEADGLGFEGSARRLLTSLARRINRLDRRNATQPLLLNPNAANLDRFLRSTVARSSLAPQPQQQ